MRKTSVLLVYIRMYPYVSRMLLVCYSYVTRMYSCGVLVMVEPLDRAMANVY